jgi:hypothetical protein
VFEDFAGDRRAGSGIGKDRSGIVIAPSSAWRRDMKFRISRCVLSPLAAIFLFALASPTEARHYRHHLRYHHYRAALIKTDVEPDEARVYVDGRYVGTADDFDGIPRLLHVTPGRHRVTFRLRGYAPYTVVVRARAGRVIDIDRRLRNLS